jgi:hypothetical protein
MTFLLVWDKGNYVWKCHDETPYYLQLMYAVK